MLELGTMLSGRYEVLKRVGSGGMADVYMAKDHKLNRNVAVKVLKSEYVEEYLKEGDFSDDGSIKIFPVAKSTELLFLNDTDWQKFADATGARYDDLKTVEGLVDTAEKYYNWTDSQTPEADDGKALFGRDAMANYLLVGTKELGCDIFEVKDGKMTLNFDEQVMRKLWDNYYVPYVKGYFAASGRFRSDDVKTGNVIGYVGSTSSATFFPTQVSDDSGASYDISLKVLPCPKFKDGDDYAVQQGAGMVVTKGSEEEIKASVEFLKWFTQPENNIEFSVGAGYLPVTNEANSIDKIKSVDSDISSSMEEILSKSVDEINNNNLYYMHAFEKGNDARASLQEAFGDIAQQDRETVEERISQGQSAEEAEAEFLTDEYFEQWYQNVLSELQAYEG
jgi:multiple sugar transport system substrate-binding protein